MIARFRWQGEATQVRVRGGLEIFPGTDLVRDGDVWSTELDIPDDVRAVYWFGLDGEDDWTKWLPDPSNPSRYVYPAGLHFTGDDEVVGSLLEGPLARPFRWTVPQDVPRGRVTLRELDGRRVWLYEPPRPAEARLLLFDGHEYTTLAPAPTVLDNLLAERLIPPVAAVLPDSPHTGRRFRELGGDPAFLAWCCETLVPLTVDVQAERSVVAGSSMGGLAATRFVSERPDLFGRALVQSGGFPGMPVVVPEGLPVRFYLDVGLLEAQLLESTRELRDDLRAKGYDVTYQEYAGGHDFFWWGETLADGLVALLSR
ncbi:MAG: alpha/beta hydrolase [Gaiellaceae bacterium]